MLMTVNAESLHIDQALGMNNDRDSVLINGTGIFLTTGDSWDFYQNYSLHVMSVNQDNKQVWVKLYHDGDLLKDGILGEGEVIVFSKNTEILNITVDTIYISPGGELITFKPVYQYLDDEYPEPEIEETAGNSSQENEDAVSGDNSPSQTEGFTIFQVLSCFTAVILCRSFIRKSR